MADSKPTDPHEHNWRGDFESARKRFFDSSLAATPAQRLKWLEEALALAARSGALPRPDESSPGHRRSETA